MDRILYFSIKVKILSLRKSSVDYGGYSEFHMKQRISEEIIYPQNLPTYLDFGTSGGLENSPLFEK